MADLHWSNLLAGKHDGFLQFCSHTQLNEHFLPGCSVLTEPLLFSFLKKAARKWYRKGSFKFIFQFDLLTSEIVGLCSVA